MNKSEWGHRAVEGPRRRFHRVVIGSGLILSIALSAPRPARAGEEPAATNEVNHEEAGRKKVFTFEGGSPIDFIVALDRHFRTRLVQILTLPETLSRTRVPKLRVPAEDPREVLTLYNRLESPTLGQWRFEPSVAAQKGASTNLNVLMLVPDKGAVADSSDRVATKVKGVPLAGIQEASWEALIRDIEMAKRQGEVAAPKGSPDIFAGSIRVQRDSKILVAAGSEAFLEMVESVVSAHRANAAIEAASAEKSNAKR